MKLYYITLGSFRNILIESTLSIEEIKEYLIKLNWKNPIVSEAIPNKLEDIGLCP